MVLISNLGEILSAQVSLQVIGCTVLISGMRHVFCHAWCAQGYSGLDWLGRLLKWIDISQILEPCQLLLNQVVLVTKQDLS